MSNFFLVYFIVSISHHREPREGGDEEGKCYYSKEYVFYSYLTCSNKPDIHNTLMRGVYGDMEPR